MADETNETNVAKESNPDLEALETQRNLMDERYNKLMDKYKASLEYIASNGINGGIEASTPQKTKDDYLKDYNDSLKAIVDHDTYKTDLERGEELCKLVEASKGLGLNSPFVSSLGTPSEEELDKAETQYQIIKNAIDNSKGSTELFKSYIMAHVVD